MTLFPHQSDALKRTSGLKNVAYYHDMGLGKTFTGAEKLMEYNNRVGLVICQKSKIRDWVEHFNLHYSCKVFDLTKQKQMGDFYGLAAGDRFNVIGVINYELAWRRKELLKLKDFTLMLDESSLIQNRKAKQSKFILQLNPKNVILLSGTPTSGKYENLWTQLHLLGWEISEKLYNTQYVNWKTIESDGFYHKIVDKDDPYKNVERLKDKLREHGADFVKTEDVFDLPEQVVTIVNVPTTKEYRTFKNKNYVRLSDGTELIGDQEFKTRLYKRQLCGMYNKDKLEAFKNLIQSTNDRVIVFYNYTAELIEMTKIVEGHHFGIVNGMRKDLDVFEKYDDCILFIQYQAGAKGLNLQKANKMIYFTLCDKSEDFEQSKKRIHRIGQERPCFYWILQCENSIEEDIYNTLLMRKDFTDELFIENPK